MLNLDFTDEQVMLRDMVRGVLDQHCSHEVVRSMEDDPVGFPTELWTQLAELGLLGLTVPESFGGSAMTLLDAVVVYEEFGRALAPLPHLVSCVAAATALLEGASDAQKAALLPGICDGSSIVSVAWLEPNNGFGPRGVQMRATASGDGFVLAGTKNHVPFASSADRILVLARTGDAADDVDLFLVDPAADGVTLTQKMTIGSDTQYRVDFDGVVVSATDRVGEAGTGWAVWQQAMLPVMVLTAAWANGGCDHALDITVAYSKDREQFGKPLGSFQALSHYMADAKTALDGSKVLNYEAAWAYGNDAADGSRQKLAAMSKLFACNSYRDSTAMAQQVFGGVGFTLEYEIQLYFRRAKQLQVSWNDTRRCEELVAEAVLDADVA